MTFTDRATTADPDRAVPGEVMDRERLTAVVQRATGRPDAVIGAVSARPASRRAENMTTQALTHVWGTLSDGTPWRVFAKTLRPVWHAPQWGLVPPFAQDEVQRTLDLQDEPRVYTSRLAEDLPPGMRLPTLFGVDEGEDRVTLWLEEVTGCGG